MDGIEGKIEGAVNDELNNPTPDVLPGKEPAKPPAQPPAATPPPAAQPPVDDPEIPIGEAKVKRSILDALELDLEGGKKVKLADLKKGFMLQEDYTKKTQEISEKEKGIKEVYDWIDAIKSHKGLLRIFTDLTEKAFGEKGYNEDYINKLVTFLGGAQQQIEEKHDDIEAQLAGLDPESTEYKILKVALLQNKQLQKELQSIKSGLETREKTETEAKQKEQQNNLVKQAEKMYSDTLTELSDPAKPDSYKFETEEEKQLWKMAVRTHLLNNPQEYAKIEKLEDFVTKVKEIGKAWYEQLKKVGDAKLAAYIKSKNLPPPQPTGKELPPPQQPPTAPTTLQGKLEQALKEQEASEQT